MRTLPPEMTEFVEWIRADVPEDGRLGFAGRAVHFYGGGNIAYLPVLAGREMMADDYYGFPRGTIEYNYPPRTYRQGSRRLSVLLARLWHHALGGDDAGRLEFLAAHPDQFERVKAMADAGTRRSRSTA